MNHDAQKQEIQEILGELIQTVDNNKKFANLSLPLLLIAILGSAIDHPFVPFLAPLPLLLFLLWDLWKEKTRRS